MSQIAQIILITYIKTNYEKCLGKRNKVHSTKYIVEKVRTFVFL